MSSQPGPETPPDDAQAAPADTPQADAPQPGMAPADTPPADTPPAEGAAPAVSADAAGGPPAEAAAQMSPAACGARLAELFPALFIAPGAPGPVKPIKLRIHADIQARAPGQFTKRVLGPFFSRYTTTNAYLKALTAPGAQRFDLDGQPAGEIAEEHRQAAEEELARRHAIAAERRAAQRQAHRPAAAAPARATDAPPRAPRPPREGPARRDAARADRPPRDDARRPEGPRPPPRRGREPQRPDRPPRPDARHDPRPAPRAEPAPAATALPVDPAQRERALLLRSFESSPLSKANFCALKRLDEATLDATLAQARQEREQATRAQGGAPGARRH